MHIAAFSFNYRKTPLSLREALALDSKTATTLGRRLLSGGVVGECMVLSTCNRTEIYLAGSCVDGIKETVAAELADFSAGDGDGDAFDIFLGKDAIRHMFRVASGVDSMVVGEAQILGQLKSAYQAATEAGTVGPYLHKICHAAFRAAKKIRTETEISAGAVSIGTLAVELIEKSVENLNSARVLIIGAGEMSSLVATRLKERSGCRIFVVGRSLEPAVALAQSVCGEAVPFESLVSHLREADVVVSCAGGGVLIKEGDVRQGSVVVDLAVPRNVDAGVLKTSGVKLFNIDDLKILAEKNKAARVDAAAKAEEIAEAESAACYADVQNIKLAPTVAELFERSNRILRAELDNFYLKNPALNEQEKTDAKKCAETIVRKILHDPIRLAKEELARPGANGVEMAKALGKIFRI